jgi:hypothetical protein
VILHSTLIAKSFRSAAHKKNTPILVYESGESLRLDEFGITQGVEGTLRLMKHLGMRSEAPEAPQTKSFRKSSWVRAKKSGLFSPSFKLGSAFEKKDTLGFINDPFGGKTTKVVFSGDGVIIGQNNNPIVHKGDALIHIAHN